MAKRRNYSPEYKREAVKLTRMEGAKISQIASDLGIRANMLAVGVVSSRPAARKHFRAKQGLE